MKKILCITAVIILISFVSTVCFAVAVGSGTVRGFINGDFDYQLSEIENRVEVIEDLFDGDTDKVLAKKTQTLNIEFEYDKITVGADASKIILAPSYDGTLCAEAMVYTNTMNDAGNISLLTNVEKDSVYYNVYVQADNIGISENEVTVRIPSGVKNIEIYADAASIEIEEIETENLSVTLKTGKTEFESGFVENCAVSIETGSLEIDRDFNFLNSFSCEISTGSAEYELPISNNVTVNYTANRCSLDGSLSLTKYSFYDSEGKKVSKPLSAGTIKPETVSLSDPIANIEIKVGSIEFDTDY